MIRPYPAARQRSDQCDARGVDSRQWAGVSSCCRPISATSRSWPSRSGYARSPIGRALRASPIMLCKPATDFALSSRNMIPVPAGQHNRTDNMNAEAALLARLRRAGHRASTPRRQRASAALRRQGAPAKRPRGIAAGGRPKPRRALARAESTGTRTAAGVVVSALSIAWLHLPRAATRRDLRTVDSLPEGKWERAARAPVALRPVMSRSGRAGARLAVRARPDGMRGGDHWELVVARG